MNKISLALFSAALLVACGDTIENQMGMDVVDSVADLPKCTGSNEGEQALVKGETSVRVCVDGEWFATASGEAADFSCKTEELKDGSGLKIVCNGDSIGVVLNGEKGKDGKNGKNGEDGKDGEDGEDGKAGTGCSMKEKTDSTVTVVCGDSTMVIEIGAGSKVDTAEFDPECVSVSLDSLVGYTQKGPFMKGSTVYLYELSNGRTLKQTNGNFTSNITRDDGRYKFNARELVSQYAMVIVDGYYRNEVTGEVSQAPIRLKAITDMRRHASGVTNSVNVNILTHLEFERVYYLVTQKQKTVKQAKRQAQEEIFKIFHMELDENTNAEDMDVFGASDADAALLAISILLQADRTESEMSALLTEISNEMVETGEWKGDRADSIKAAMADWVFTKDLVKFRENVEGWGLNGGGAIGNFEKFIESFVAEEIFGEKACAKNDDGKIMNVKNELSVHAGETYQCWDGMIAKKSTFTGYNKEIEDGKHLECGGEIESIDLSYGKMIDWRDRQIYRTIKVNVNDETIEMMAENLNYDYRVKVKDEMVSSGNSCYKGEADSCSKYGRLYSWGAAMDSAGLFSSGGVGCGYNRTCTPMKNARGICPEGWHLPDSTTWLGLERVANFVAYFEMHYDEDAAFADTTVGRIFKSQTGWDGDNGSDNIGLTLLPAGMARKIDPRYDYYQGTGRYTYFWTSSYDRSQNAACGISVDYKKGYASGCSIHSDYGYSVRCVKD